MFTSLRNTQEMIDQFRRCFEDGSWVVIGGEAVWGAMAQLALVAVAQGSTVGYGHMTHSAHVRDTPETAFYLTIPREAFSEEGMRVWLQITTPHARIPQRPLPSLILLGSSPAEEANLQALAQSLVAGSCRTWADITGSN